MTESPPSVSDQGRRAEVLPPEDQRDGHQPQVGEPLERAGDQVRAVQRVEAPEAPGLQPAVHDLVQDHEEDQDPRARRQQHQPRPPDPGRSGRSLDDHGQPPHRQRRHAGRIDRVGHPLGDGARLRAADRVVEHLDDDGAIEGEPPTQTARENQHRKRSTNERKRIGQRLSESCPWASMSARPAGSPVAVGSTTVNMLPRPGSLAASIEPPWASAIQRQMLSPRPDPPTDRAGSAW